MTLPPKVIVSPIDFSTHSDDALGTAADLASRFGSELCLVHVVPAIPKLPSARTIFKEAEYEQALHADAEKQLGQMAEKLARRGIVAKFVVGTANDTSMEILRLAEENRADLIVIATHGMTGWHKLAFGSVTEKLVRLAASPVLVLRARPEGEAGDRSATRNSVAVAR
jgi:nucleotide-binding universal stress UspA family protein